MKRRRGQALVEFTFVFPFLLAAVLGIFDVARAMFVQLSLDSAVLAAGRRAGLERGAGSRVGLLEAARQAAPGLEIPADALELRNLPGPGGEAWLELEVHAPVEFHAAALLAAEPRLVLRASTRVKIEAAP